MRISNDLISRSALIQSLRNNVLVDVTPNLEQAIEEQPTAYDVDKVVERLDGEIFLTTDDDGNTNDFSIRVMEADEVIKIVKSGGME